jgi:hypothetical protein
MGLEMATVAQSAQWDWRWPLLLSPRLFNQSNGPTIHSFCLPAHTYCFHVAATLIKIATMDTSLLRLLLPPFGE